MCLSLYPRCPCHTCFRERTHAPEQCPSADRRPPGGSSLAGRDLPRSLPYARDDAGEASRSIDLLVEFARPVNLFHFVRVKRQDEEILGIRVDLVTRDALKGQLRETILREAVRAA